MPAAARPSQSHEERVRESALILQWLYDNPVDRALILFLAANPKDEWSESYEFTPITAAQVARLASQVEAVSSYLGRALVGACHRCLCATLELEDGLVDWPLVPHVCRGIIAPARPQAVRQAERHTGAAL